jgi:hypothetical protein
MIATPGMQPYYDTASADELAARDRYIPLGRLGTTEAVVVFLASKMAAYLNRLVLPRDCRSIG